MDEGGKFLGICTCGLLRLAMGIAGACLDIDCPNGPEGAGDVIPAGDATEVGTI